MSSLFSYDPLKHRYLTFYGDVYKNDDNVTSSGSFSYGIEDTTTGTIVAQNTITTPSIIPISMSGSIDLTTLGLTPGHVYRSVFTKSSITQLSAPQLYLVGDYITASGSIQGGDVYVNANNQGAHNPDGYLYFNATSGTGSNDEGAYLKYNNTYQRLDTNKPVLIGGNLELNGTVVTIDADDNGSIRQLKFGGTNAITYFGGVGFLFSDDIVAQNKNIYTDTSGDISSAGALSAGTTLTVGGLTNVNNNRITGVATPSYRSDAANMGYVNDRIGWFNFSGSLAVAASNTQVITLQSSRSETTLDMRLTMIWRRNTLASTSSKQIAIAYCMSGNTEYADSQANVYALGTEAADLTVALAAVGSNNQLTLTVSNADASNAMNGRYYLEVRPDAGYVITKV